MDSRGSNPQELKNTPDTAGKELLQVVLDDFTPSNTEFDLKNKKVGYMGGECEVDDHTQQKVARSPTRPISSPLQTCV
ncbi:hypothetical protein Tco_0660746 [Tanacetum coccineum]